MEYIEDHDCEKTRNVDNPRVVKYRTSRKDGWYFVYEDCGKTICNGIEYCPYCGKRLNSMERYGIA